MSALRIGIISTAHHHAHSYLHALGQMAGVEVRVAPEPEDVNDLLAAWQPHGVIVCSENVYHRRDTTAALAAGAHVLCEKPLATSIEDAAAIVSAAKTADKQVMIAHPVRFSTAFQALQQSYERGDLGEAVAISGTNNGQMPTDPAWFSDPALAGGGAVTDHVVHVADLIDALLDGVAPVEVHAHANRILHAERAEVETAGIVQIRYASGVIATIDCSWSRPPDYATWGGLTMDVVGSRGFASMDAFRQRIEGHFTGQGQAWVPYGEDADALLIAEFLDVVRTGRTPSPDANAGLRGVQIVAAAYESIRTGERVSITST